MIRRLIIFLIRRRLKLRKGEMFRFANQKTDNVYYFTSDRLKGKFAKRIVPWNKKKPLVSFFPLKVTGDSGKVSRREKSLVSLNWILDEGCVIIREGKR